MFPNKGWSDQAWAVWTGCLVWKQSRARPDPCLLFTAALRHPSSQFCVALASLCISCRANTPSSDRFNRIAQIRLCAQKLPPKRDDRLALPIAFTAAQLKLQTKDGGIGRQAQSVRPRD